MVTIKRVSSELSPSALRKWEMYCFRFPSSTNVPPQTACSNSSLVIRRLGFCTSRRRTSKAFGVRETGKPVRDRVRLDVSSRNSPKQYKWLMGAWLAHRDIQSFLPFFRSLLKDFPQAELLEVGVLGFGLLVDGNVGIGVLPQIQERLVGLL